MVYNCINFILNELYPPTCLLCGAPGENDLDICGECRVELPENGCCCSYCAAPLPDSTESHPVCGHCLRQVPKFDRCLAPFRYEPPVDQLIAGLKFHRALTNGRLLSSLMLDFLAGQLDQCPQLIVPVPLHPARLRQRGYNQALELARPLGRHLRIPIGFGHCDRRVATRPQMDLERKQRLSNVRAAFALKKPIRVSHLALLDDVVTTAATVSELAAVFKRDGVERVDVWALARTP